MSGSVDILPPYLQHRNLKQEKASAQTHRAQILSRGKSVLKELAEEEKGRRQARLWVVQEPDLNAWQRTSLDAWSIYSMREETLIKDDTDANKTPPQPSLDRQETLDLIQDFQILRERTYISESIPPKKNTEKVDQKRFAKFILQRYKTPVKFRTSSYCAPRDFHAQTFVKEKSIKDLFENKSNPEIKLNPRKQLPVTASHGNFLEREFCDTLGPSACKSCIEETNRKIVKEVEQSSFPELECSATTLVAPSLAMTMVKANRMRLGSRAGSRSRHLRSRESDVLLPPVRRSGKGSRSVVDSTASVHERASVTRQQTAQTRAGSQQSGRENEGVISRESTTRYDKKIVHGKPRSNMVRGMTWLGKIGKDLKH